jgi:hypothetical protein
VRDAVAIAAGVGAELEVLLGGQLEKGAAPVGHVGDAAARDLLGLASVDAARAERDLALHAHHAADRAQRRGLAGAIGAEDGGDAAFVDREVDAVQHLGLRIECAQIAGFEQRRHQWAVPR